MSALNVVLTALLVLGAVPSAIWGSLRLKSWYEETKEKERFFLRSIVQALKELTTKVSEFKCLQVTAIPLPADRDRVSYTDARIFLDEQAENLVLHKGIRYKLRRLTRAEDKYMRWLNEAEYITDLILNKEIERRKKLSDNWDCFGRGGLAIAIKEIAYSKLYEGTLSLEYVKEAFVREYGPDFAVTIMENTHEVHIRLRENILETTDFYRLIEELVKAGNRPSVEELQIAQRELLREVESAQGAIFKRDKKLLYEFENKE